MSRLYSKSLDKDLYHQIFDHFDPKLPAVQFYYKMILGKKKKGSSDKRTKSSASRELSKSKQTGISHGGAGGRQKTNKSVGSGKIKSKSPVKSNYKSFESLASCRDRYKTQEMSNFLFLNQFVDVFQTGFR